MTNRTVLISEVSATEIALMLMPSAARYSLTAKNLPCIFSESQIPVSRSFWRTSHDDTYRLKQIVTFLKSFFVHGKLFLLFSQGSLITPQYAIERDKVTFFNECTENNHIGRFGTTESLSDVIGRYLYRFNIIT